MQTAARLLLLPVLACGPIWAGGNSSSAHSTAGITIVRPILMRKTQDLYFGALLVDPASPGGAIKQHAAFGGGTREGDPAGVTQVALSTEHWHNAEFEIRGEPGANFSVHMPRGTIQISAPSPSATSSLPVVALNYYAESAIDPGGMTRIWIGGTLQLPANPSPGHYTALFPVTVAYY